MQNRKRGQTFYTVNKRAVWNNISLTTTVIQEGKGTSSESTEAYKLKFVPIFGTNNLGPA